MTNFAKYRAMTHFPSMTGLRSVCAIGVVKVHAEWVAPLPRLFEESWLGVDMFFVISGYLIVTLLLREKERTGTVDLPAFYTRRTLRIFPIYYLCVLGLLAFGLVISPWKPATLHFYQGSILVFLFYLQDWVVVNMGILFHTWSLAMEEQFYLVWPALEKYLSGRALAVLLAVAIFVNELVNFNVFSDAIVHVYGFPEATQQPIFLITFAPILMGVAMAHLLHNPKYFEPFHRVLAHFWAPGVIVALAVAVCELTPGPLLHLPRFLLHLLFCALLASVVLTPKHCFTWLLDHPIAVYLGTISYGLYLYHVYMLELLLSISKRLGMPDPSRALIFFGTLALTVGVAQLSYRYLEGPLLKRRSHGKKPVSVAPATGA